MVVSSINEAAPTLTPKRKLFSTSNGSNTIGIIEPSYNTERVSYMLQPAGFDYIKLSKFPFDRFSEHLIASKLPILFGSKTKLVHTFNTIPANRQFVVSFEMELPRFLHGSPEWHKNLGRSILRSSRCRQILALSEAAASHMTLQPGYAEIVEKISVFRGAVLPAIGSAIRTEYANNGAIKLLFIGRDGLRKGLGPTIDSAIQLRNNGVEVELHIIGDPSSQTYVVPGENFDTDNLFEKIKTHSWITHTPRLPNHEVRALMATQDLLIFPTMDESLGWVIAEAALSGLPCISTNIFAIPELIVDDRTGWLMNVGLGPDRRWTETGKAFARAAWDAVQSSLTAQLTSRISYLSQNRPLIAQAGVAATRHIQSLYGMDLARERLAQIYRDATR